MFKRNKETPINQPTIRVGFKGRLIVSHNTRIPEENIIPPPEWAQKRDLERTWRFLSQLLQEMKQQYGPKLELSMGARKFSVDLVKLSQVAEKWHAAKNQHALEVIFSWLGTIDMLDLTVQSLNEAIEKADQNR